MNNEEIYSLWAPEDSVWSLWAKPVLFAHLNLPLGEALEEDSATNITWSPAPLAGVAIVLDLPGAEGIRFGLKLATRGYRPVPLYNALPLPSNDAFLEPTAAHPIAPVNVLPIILALRESAAVLAKINLPPNAPPVFLLDANRRAEGYQVRPEEFDNRSVCFTTDFPSANFLKTQAIQSILLVQQYGPLPQPDLAHVLRGWQEAGLPIQGLQLYNPGQPELLTIPRPPWFGAMFQRALIAFGLSRASTGGFGAWMPDSSAGG